MTLIVGIWIFVAGSFFSAIVSAVYNRLKDGRPKHEYVYEKLQEYKVTIHGSPAGEASRYRYKICGRCGRKYELDGAGDYKLIESGDGTCRGK